MHIKEVVKGKKGRGKKTWTKTPTMHALSMVDKEASFPVSIRIDKKIV